MNLLKLHSYSADESNKEKSITDLLLDWGDNQDSEKELLELFEAKYPDGTFCQVLTPSSSLTVLVKTDQYLYFRPFRYQAKFIVGNDFSAVIVVIGLSSAALCHTGQG